MKCSGGTTGMTQVTDASMCTTTSTTDALDTGMIRVFPNPSYEQFTLSLTDKSGVKIFTIEGKLVEIFYEVSELNFGSDYSKGVYVVYISSD